MLVAAIFCGRECQPVCHVVMSIFPCMENFAEMSAVNDSFPSQMHVPAYCCFFTFSSFVFHVSAIPVSFYI